MQKYGFSARLANNPKYSKKPPYGGSLLSLSGYGVGMPPLAFSVSPLM